MIADIGCYLCSGFLRGSQALSAVTICWTSFLKTTECTAGRVVSRCECHSSIVKFWKSFKFKNVPTLLLWHYMFVMVGRINIVDYCLTSSLRSSTSGCKTWFIEYLAMYSFLHVIARWIAVNLERYLGRRFPSVMIVLNNATFSCIEVLTQNRIYIYPQYWSHSLGTMYDWNKSFIDHIHTKFVDLPLWTQRVAYLNVHVLRIHVPYHVPILIGWHLIIYIQMKVTVVFNTRYWMTLVVYIG